MLHSELGKAQILAYPLHERRNFLGLRIDINALNRNMQRNLERFIAFLLNHLLRTARERVGYGKAHTKSRS